MRLTSLGHTLVFATLVAIAPAAQTPAPQAPAATRPKLVVLVVIDQFRADYVDLYGHQWTKGLRRLVDSGHTVVVVEHHEALIGAADWVVALGPGAGPAGGRVVFEGRSRSYLQGQAATGVRSAPEVA